MLIVIGAEGGFAKEEVELLRQHDFACVSLGGRILRAETAAFYALSVISFITNYDHRHHWKNALCMLDSHDVFY